MEGIFDGMGQYAYIAAIFVPIIVGFAAKAAWPSWAKFLMAVGLSLIIGAVTVWQTSGEWQWTVPFILSLIGTAELVYRIIIKNIPGMADWLASKGYT